MIYCTCFKMKTLLFSKRISGTVPFVNKYLEDVTLVYHIQYFFIYSISSKNFVQIRTEVKLISVKKVQNQFLVNYTLIQRIHIKLQQSMDSTDTGVAQAIPINPLPTSPLEQNRRNMTSATFSARSRSESPHIWLSKLAAWQKFNKLTDNDVLGYVP